MKKVVLIAFATLTMVAMVACGGKKQTENTEENCCAQTECTCEKPCGEDCTCGHCKKDVADTTKMACCQEGEKKECCKKDSAKCCKEEGKKCPKEAQQEN